MVIWGTEACLVFLMVGRQNIRIRCVKMVENVVRRHSAVSDVAMAKGAEEEFVNSREDIWAKGFVCTVVIVKEYGSGGVGIPKGSDLRYGGSDGNIWCCTSIRQRY